MRLKKSLDFSWFSCWVCHIENILLKHVHVIQIKFIFTRASVCFKKRLAFSSKALYCGLFCKKICYFKRGYEWLENEIEIIDISNKRNILKSNIEQQSSDWFIQHCATIIISLNGPQTGKEVFLMYSLKRGFKRL